MAESLPTDLMKPQTRTKQWDNEANEAMKYIIGVKSQSKKEGRVEK